MAPPSVNSTHTRAEDLTHNVRSRGPIRYTSRLCIPHTHTHREDLTHHSVCFRDPIRYTCPYKNEKVAARLQLGCCYYAAIKYACNNWWRQSSQLERLVACLQQPCSFYQRLQAHRATTRSQLQLAVVTSKKTARTRS